MVVLGLSAHFIFTSVIIGLLLDRGVCGVGKNVQIATSNPWFPSGPPPTKPLTEELTSEALRKILPLVTFDCKGKTGFFPDSKFNCEVFHHCKPDGARNTFLCPANSLFNQLSMVCEEKSLLNVRICKEGSISPNRNNPGDAKKRVKPTLKQAPRKKYVAPNASQRYQGAPAKKFNDSKTDSGYLVTLEDLLGFMNSEHNKELTLGSSFSAAKAVPSSSDTLVKVPTSSVKPVNERKFSKPSSTNGPVKVSGNLSQKVYSTTERITVPSHLPLLKVDAKPSASKPLDDFSVEYDAIEGRKHRKHKRVGRVLDFDGVPQLQTKGKRMTHSHVSVRSPTENPPEDFTRLSASNSTTKNGISSSPSLFTADRSKAKDFRKRRRNFNRRKKGQRHYEITTEIPITEIITTIPTTQIPSVETDSPATSDNHKPTGQEAEESDHNVELSQAWRGLSETGQVEPYTLPPLPTVETENIETTTHVAEKEESLSQHKKKHKGGRTRNPWYKTTPYPDYYEVKFGEKISDLDHHHYRTNVKIRNNPAEPFEDETEAQLPSSFPEDLTEEYKERSLQQPKQVPERHNRPKYRNVETPSKKEEHEFIFPLPSSKLEILEKAPEDLFPPPRAESREQKPAREQISNLYDSSSEKSTTESSFKSTPSYTIRHHVEILDQYESEDYHWKQEENKKKMKAKKLEVGSTFSSHTSTPEVTTGYRIPTTEAPVTESPVSKKKLPKVTTLAHQQLLKLMNDFFSASPPGSKDVKNFKYIDDMTAPNFRGSEEDMIAGSESIMDEVGELPPELLDVVDFIAEHSEGVETELNPDTSHEVIKISGPITNKHLKELFSGGEFDVAKRRKKARDESIKKLVAVPPEEKENLKDISQVATFTSLRLEPLLKQMTSDKPSVTVIPYAPEQQKRKPTILTAKKIPVRVIYKDHFSEQSKSMVNKQPNLKVIRSRLPKPTLQIIQNGRITPSRPYNPQHPKPRTYPNTQPPVIIHPKSLYPPHPPPLPKKKLSFKLGFPFAGGVRPLRSSMRYVPRRKRRSILNRDRRQLRHNPHFFPFPRPMFPTFNPKFVPTFSPFKNIFAPNGLHSAGSSIRPFSFPKFEIPKPPFSPPPVFKPAASRPPPVRHVTQSGHQTIIVEEVPVPIHVEVPDPNLLRPAHLGNVKKNLVNPFQNNQFRPPSPPALQKPPLPYGFQGSFPVNPNYRPFGMPSNVRPPVLNYQPSLPYPQPLSPSITNQGLYGLGVTSKPFVPIKPPPLRVTNSLLDVAGKPPGHFQPFNVHANAYPNFPYFQGAFTTPLSNEPVAGRLMYSGYKPPKTSPGPRTTALPNRDRKEKSRNNNKPQRPRSKPTESYYVTKNPYKEQYTNYQMPNRDRSPSHQPDTSRENPEMRSVRPNYNRDSMENGAPRRRRPNRKRRPRPYTLNTTPAIQVSNDISPTPPPPEQIPPPPADYTSLPLNQETKSLHNPNEVSTNVETSSLYPPAGYYGKDQLVQFFDISAKPYKKESTANPYEQNDLGESTSSAELDESVSGFSVEDSDQPAFGTRLRSQPQTHRRKRKRQQIQSQTQRSEIRARPTSSPGQSDVKVTKRDSETLNKRPYRNQERNETPTPRKRQRPTQYRAPNRQMSEPPRKVEVKHFTYNGNNGFYSVPSGLQSLVDPSQTSSQGNRGSTDMFGIPHPAIDQSIYSLRPQGAPGDFGSNFFSVPPEVAQQQQSSLHNMNIKPIPKSAREFFANAAKEASSYKSSTSSEDKESEGSPKPSGNSTTEEGKAQRRPVVRKIRKPKRKNRYNPRTNENNQTTVTSESSQIAETKPNTQIYKQTSTIATTTYEPSPVYLATSNSNTQNDIKEPVVAFKQRAPLLPKTLPDISKSLLNGKIDIKKLNATISTSVSVSGAFPQSNKTHSEDSTNRRVFSSQNGGLAVVKSNPKRKRTKHKSTMDTNDSFISNSEPNAKAKYEIAASVLDIIKATAESEKQGNGFYSNRYDQEEGTSESQLSKAWAANPAMIHIDYKRNEKT